MEAEAVTETAATEPESTVSAPAMEADVRTERSRKLQALLGEPFPSKEVLGRVGSTSRDKAKGQVLAYVRARTVMKRLDEALGPDNWKDEYRPLGEKGFICRITYRVPGTDEWIYKEDVADLSQIEPIKGGASDAFKRAAIKLGVGRYLYDLESPWVRLEDGCLPRNFQFPLPDWAKPEAEHNGQPPVAAKVAPAEKSEQKIWNFPQGGGKPQADDGLL
ncbi:Rad52/Rad22 family DNA repair protein [Thiomonas sp.]